MGYPMTYQRVVNRNYLTGDYSHVHRNEPRTDDGPIAGDLRRLERDQRDDHHLFMYALTASITMAQARAVLDAFFDGFSPEVEEAAWGARQARTGAEWLAHDRQMKRERDAQRAPTPAGG